MLTLRVFLYQSYMFVYVSVFSCSAPFIFQLNSATNHLPENQNPCVTLKKCSPTPQKGPVTPKPHHGLASELVLIDTGARKCSGMFSPLVCLCPGLLSTPISHPFLSLCVYTKRWFGAKVAVSLHPTSGAGGHLHRAGK